ncbi:MAG: DNA-3-methyladenine glycosylase family protein [Waterburya sp.]
MNQVAFITVIQELTERDRDLAQIINKLGYPPQWQRQPGFPTLIQIILEQQVSLASALATFKRLNLAVTTLTPATFLSLDDLQLKEIGFSRQKTRYGRELAQAIMEQVLNLDELANLDDLSIRKKLTAIKGIGDWTVDMYLMMALQRLDIFPSKDLAVAIAIQEIKNLPSRPSTKALELIAQPWQPYRAIATQILWHYYLNRKIMTNY